MQMEWALHGRGEFIAWYLALPLIHELLLAAVPVFLAVVLLKWAFRAFRRYGTGASQSVFLPIFLLLTMFCGFAWLLFGADTPAEPVAISQPVPHVLHTPPAVDPEVQPAASPLVPPSSVVDCLRCPGPAVARGAEFSVLRSDDGHFYVPAVVNGRSVAFMVDTGATFTTLPMSMAGDLGVVQGRAISRFTANGVANGVQATGVEVVLLDAWSGYVDVDVLPDVPAALLGQDVLSRFDLETKGDRLYFHGH